MEDPHGCNRQGILILYLCVSSFQIQFKSTYLVYGCNMSNPYFCLMVSQWECDYDIWHVWTKSFQFQLSLVHRYLNNSCTGMGPVGCIKLLTHKCSIRIPCLLHPWGSSIGLKMRVTESSGLKLVVAPHSLVHQAYQGLSVGQKYGSCIVLSWCCIWATAGLDHNNSCSFRLFRSLAMQHIHLPTGPISGNFSCPSCRHFCHLSGSYCVSGTLSGHIVSPIQDLISKAYPSISQLYHFDKPLHHFVLQKYDTESNILMLFWQESYDQFRFGV